MNFSLDFFPKILFFVERRKEFGKKRDISFCRRETTTFEQHALLYRRRDTPPLLGPRKKRFILSTLKEKEEEEEEEGKPAEKDSTHRLAAREMMAH